MKQQRKKIAFITGDKIITLEMGRIAFWVLRKTGFRWKCTVADQTITGETATIITYDEISL